MPPLIISYGMTKSGSTLAYHIARAVLEGAGFAQPVLSQSALGAARRINYVDDLTEERITAILSEAPGPIVIKTHQRPTAQAAQMLRDGHAVGHACLRDPRDIALSMLDHGLRARTKGHVPFAEMETLADAERSLHDQIETLTQWCALPRIIPLPYNDIAFNGDAAAHVIAAQLGLTCPDGIVARVKEANFTQFNKGIKDRHLTEMEPDTSAHFAATFPALVRAAAQPSCGPQ